MLVLILGIDLGSSSTDAVLVSQSRIIKKASFSPPISLSKLEGELKKKKWPAWKIKKVAITGGKKSEYKKQFFGKKVFAVNEIRAIALGGSILAKKRSCVVASLGTGTAIVSKKGAKIMHISGTGVSGGTVIGLSGLLLKTQNIEKIQKLASRGKIENVDLKVRDVVGSGIKTLAPDLTASNFAKLQSRKKEDIAASLLNLAAETNGIIISLASKNSRQKNIVVTGKLLSIPFFRKRLFITAKLYGLTFQIPKHWDIATAFGAAKGI